MPKRILYGKVVSSNSNKTITVDVTRRIKHKLYKKIIRQTKKQTEKTKTHTNEMNFFIYLKLIRLRVIPTDITNLQNN